MAISVDDVYKTVLLILNKEQRGYITPTEFNKIATQVQLEIFENYFQYENRQYRVPDNESEYSDRYKNVDEKIAIFKERAILNILLDPDWGVYFDIPITDLDFYKLGTVIYTDPKGNRIEVQKTQENDLLYLNSSPLTKPTKKYPLYLYKETNRLYVYPQFNAAGEGIGDREVSITYLRKPKDVIWGYSIDTSTGGYVWDGNQDGPPYYPSDLPGGSPVPVSENFELHETEQTELIIKILMYSGVVIRDPQIVQSAAGMDQQETMQENS
jgi:hypothetical protein